MSAAGWGITAVYLLLALLVVSLWLHARLPVAVKLGAVVLVTASYWLTWTALPGFAGWPADEALPGRFQLLASEIQEPNAATGFAGVIHVWVVDLTGDRPAAAPRAYRLAYGKDLHTALVEAKQRMLEGMPQLGRRTDDVRIGVPLDRTRYGDPRNTLDRLQIENLPDPRLPEK